MSEKRQGITRGDEQQFHRGRGHMLVSPSGYKTKVRVVASNVEINRRRRLIAGVSRSILAAAALGATLYGGAAQAQTNCRPDYNGGYMCSDSRGGTTTIRPDYNGGYITNSPNGTGTIRPDYNGGWNIQQPQQPQQRGLGGGIGGCPFGTMPQLGGGCR